MKRPSIKVILIPSALLLAGFIFIFIR